MAKIEVNKIYQGHALEILRQWPDECVDTIITSPPYWGLRDYGGKRISKMIDEQGWILRNVIVGHKPNSLPSSVKDRFTKVVGRLL